MTTEQTTEVAEAGPSLRVRIHRSPNGIICARWTFDRQWHVERCWSRTAEQHFALSREVFLNVQAVLASRAFEKLGVRVGSSLIKDVLFRALG